MIKLNGAAQREFCFGANAASALAYFGSLSSMIQHLPHIELLEEFSSSEVRVRYSSLELGAYTITVITDLVSEMDEDNLAITIRPLDGREAVKSEATLNSTIGYGYFASAAYLEDAGDKTLIDFRLKIAATLPRPRGLRMMPGRVVSRIASSISQGRVNEIIDGFMANAIEAYPQWLAEHKQPRL
ncbi:MAG: hypothetical protein ACK2UK_00270 [Candidatus Promineifilaceae bacterium]|jgi:hypothetical protein